MEKESPPEKPNQTNSIERHTVADDLKFIRSVIEKTHRSFDPGSPVIIIWGLILLIGYPATHYLLATPQLYDFIQPMWIILWVIGASVTIFYGTKSEKREKRAGVISQTSKQIGGVWYILLVNASAWSGIGLSKGFFANPAFLWAIIFAFGLSVMGILSSREWLFGGITIFAAILITFFIRNYTYFILGLAMSAGCIIPAIIAQRRYLKQQREND